MSLEELRKILIAHGEKYPMMQPTDAVKLIYQNEFGGGHLIRDEIACMNYLFREFNCIEKKDNIPPIESIGNGLVRVNLAAIKKLQLESLGQAFIRSATAHKGSAERFHRKLELLEALTAEGNFSFGKDELRQYLMDYKAAGCPAVSHSEVYRQQYQPSYRVIRQCDWENNEPNGA